MRLRISVMPTNSDLEVNVIQLSHANQVVLDRSQQVPVSTITSMSTGPVQEQVEDSRGTVKWPNSIYIDL